MKIRTTAKNENIMMIQFLKSSFYESYTSINFIMSILTKVI